MVCVLISPISYTFHKSIFHPVFHFLNILLKRVREYIFLATVIKDVCSFISLAILASKHSVFALDTEDIYLKLEERFALFTHEMSNI